MLFAEQLELLFEIVVVSFNVADYVLGICRTLNAVLIGKDAFGDCIGTARKNVGNFFHYAYIIQARFVRLAKADVFKVVRHELLTVHIVR